MTPNDLEYINPIHLYDKLLTEILCKLKKYPQFSNIKLQRFDLSTGWLPCLIFALQKKVPVLLEFLSKDILRVSDFKKYIEEAKHEAKLINSVKPIVIGSKAITGNLLAELLELKDYFGQVNLKLFNCFFEAMMLSLDRSLREISVFLNDYLMPEQEIPTVDVKRLFEDLCRLAVTEPGAANILS